MKDYNLEHQSRNYTPPPTYLAGSAKIDGYKINSWRVLAPYAKMMIESLIQLNDNIIQDLLSKDHTKHLETEHERDSIKANHNKLLDIFKGYLYGIVAAADVMIDIYDDMRVMLTDTHFTAGTVHENDYIKFAERLTYDQATLNTILTNMDKYDRGEEALVNETDLIAARIETIIDAQTPDPIFTHQEV